jgi:hypothetical protein
LIAKKPPAPPESCGLEVEVPRQQRRELVVERRPATGRDAVVATERVASSAAAWLATRPSVAAYRRSSSVPTTDVGIDTSSGNDADEDGSRT